MSDETKLSMYAEVLRASPVMGEFIHKRVDAALEFLYACDSGNDSGENEEVLGKFSLPAGPTKVLPTHR